jgi:hypothetical protein
MVNLKQAFLSLAATLMVPLCSEATVWQYSWDNTQSLFGNNDGGTWRFVSFTQDDVSGILSGEITLDTSINHTDALWLSVTHGPTPDSASGNYAGIYLHEGRMIVRPYDSSPVDDHYLSNIIYDSGYSVSDLGSMRTFSFSLDTNIVNSWAGGGLSWGGIGFPRNALGETGGDLWTPYRIGAWIRSFADNSVDIVPGSLSPVPSTDDLWDVTWGDGGDNNIGTWDIGNATVTPVPEPSSALMAGLGAMILVRRKRRGSLKR